MSPEAEAPVNSTVHIVNNDGSSLGDLALCAGMINLRMYTSQTFIGRMSTKRTLDTARGRYESDKYCLPLYRSSILTRASKHEHDIQ